MSKPKAKAKTRPSAKKPTAPAAKGRRIPIGWIAGGALAVAVVIAMVLSFGGTEEQDTSGEFGTPRVDGQALPLFSDPATDTAIGLAIPEVDGADFGGSPVAIRRDGIPKALLFLAHWCPACQAEVPEVQQLVNDGAVPEGIEIISVVTATNEARPNFPPSSWLQREGWTSPVIVDGEDSLAYQSFGAGAFPFWVFVDGAGNVFGRVSGALPIDQVQSIFTALAET